MEIKIITPTQEDIAKVLYYVQEFCINNYKEFQLLIDGKLKKEVKNAPD